MARVAAAQGVWSDVRAGEVLGAVQAKDDAFLRFVVPHTHRLWCVAFGILGDAGEAEEAVQDVMVKGWKAFAELDGDPVAWLIRVTVNHCVSRRRYLRTRHWIKRPALRDDVVDARVRSVEAADPDLVRALGRLTVRQRAIVTLTYLHGFTVDEAATAMQCAPGTARSHLARALCTLRQEIRDDR